MKPYYESTIKERLRVRRIEKKIDRIMTWFLVGVASYIIANLIFFGLLLLTGY